MTELDRKYDKLKAAVRELGSAALAFSGGADSALLAYIAARELGTQFTAVTITSPLLLQSDADDAARFCSEYDIGHVLIPVDILADEKFAANDDQRCYYCKCQIFETIRHFADVNALEHVMDGTNKDDQPTRRPGMRVLTEMNIRSPLRETGFTKQEVRDLSRQLGLFTWNKESDSCKATKLPSKTPITQKSLNAA